ncbi:nucleoside hydrolase [Paenibacillus sabinae]|uniref:Inosine/uridine-preferring nucleoside hydrolase n=1 Tax=Paenibacillus sabinae T27 TaxID=1268072 RepID=X5A325_9BACL|nr:nucleoside hydrolase [Paenibacillus sabinae]AHV98214.1 inosine/uridine-preferring nucleoside hydrolase [Paenibacillus sabinae T27]
MPNKHQLILDVDTGIDDAFAILYALKSQHIHIEGICTGFGNTDVAQATDNTLRIIKLANPGYDVPVAPGASGPLERKWGGSVVHVHGDNGIGNAELPPSNQLPLEESAADFMIRKANEQPGELILVTLGSLTNLALALEKDPSIRGKFKHVVMMGGTVFSHGNVTPVAEANFHVDPEAAALVFKSGLPLTMVGLDVTLQAKLTMQHLDWMDRNARQDCREVVEFLRASLAYYFNFYTRVNDFIDACPLHDPLALLVAVDPSLVKIQTLKAEIECSGSLTSGMVVTDRRPHPLRGNDVNICLEVDAERAIGKLVTGFI